MDSGSNRSCSKSIFQLLVMGLIKTINHQGVRKCNLVFRLRLKVLLPWHPWVFPDTNRLTISNNIVGVRLKIFFGILNCFPYWRCLLRRGLPKPIYPHLIFTSQKTHANTISAQSNHPSNFVLTLYLLLRRLMQTLSLPEAIIQAILDKRA